MIAAGISAKASRGGVFKGGVLSSLFDPRGATAGEGAIERRVALGIVADWCGVAH